MVVKYFRRLPCAPLLTLIFAATLAVATSHAAAPLDSTIRKTYAIAPGPLGDVLAQFAASAAVPLSFDPTPMANIRSEGLQGAFSVREGFERLLRGTGYELADKGDGAYSLQKQSAPQEKSKQSAVQESKPELQEVAITLPPVTVQDRRESVFGPVDGYVATQSATGTKTDTPLIESPRSISVITADQISDQQATSVDEALRYTAGVASEPRGYDLSQSDFSIRGFWSGVPLLDGMRSRSGAYGFANTETYGLERVEVLKGPPSGVYGEGSPGGLVNLISKRPTDKFFAEVESNGGNWYRYGGKFDVGGPIDAGKSLLFRLTGLARDGHTQVDFTKDGRFYVAPALTWQPTLDTKLTLLTKYQKDDTFAVQFIPASGTIIHNPNGKIPTRRYVGEPSFDQLDNMEYSAGYLFEHRLSDTWTFRNNFRFTYNDLDYGYLYGFGLQADTRTLTRGVFTADELSRGFTTDSHAEARFQIGPTAHTALLGLDYKRAFVSSTFTDAPGPDLDIFNPVYGQPFTLGSPYVDNSQNFYQLGFYLQDHIKFFEKWVLMLGGRYDWSTTRTDDKLAEIKTQQNDNAFTGQVGLLYLFDNGLAPYFSYATSFEPELGSDASGSPFVPTTGKQYEVGIKYQPAGYTSLITLSAFEITRQDVLTTDPNNVNFSIQKGEVRARGIEIEAKAKLFESFNVIANYSFIDAKITKSNDGDKGNRPGQTPEHLASLWAHYKIPDGMLGGLGFGAGVRYVGSSLDYSNAIKVPAFTLVDAGLQYEFKGQLKGVRLAVNASNLFDKSFVASCESLEVCQFGARRSLTGSIGFRW